MKIDQNVSLANYSTMGLGGRAAYLCEVANKDEIKEAFEWAKARNLPALMIGGGSNIVWQDSGYPGLLIVNNIPGFTISQLDNNTYSLKIGAGEVWDSVVERSVEAGLTGIEALSLIPGKTGATPVQNVGAYGQEISETLTKVEALDTQTGEFATIAGNDCAFGYRSSRFKTTDRGRFFITGITLHLRHGNPQPPFYASVQAYFDEHDIHKYTPEVLRQAVIAIRSAKLPDPAIVHNTGSFFANPVLSEEEFLELQTTYSDLPHWQTSNGIKVSAAWLIDQAGFKDYHDPETGMRTWPRQPLVLVNEKAKSTADLLRFKQKIVDTVQDKFGITLEQEPELLP